MVASEIADRIRQELGKFQSPSLRGSGRFRGLGVASRDTMSFQSPSLRGSGRFRTALAKQLEAMSEFQSPSLRGSGRFPRCWRCWSASAAFQSPSLRGSGRFALSHAARRPPPWGFNPLHCGAVVASARGWGPAPGRGAGFNPLHCGAVVASKLAKCESDAEALVERLRNIVSIPFIAGQWSLRRGFTSRCRRRCCFNPLHCGAVVASPKNLVTD